MHLAQVNVARAKGPMEGAVMAEFARALDPINLLAERTPGFVWRLQDADGDATALRVFDDGQILINLSVWRSVDALRAYTYQSGHAHYVKRRKEWFSAFGRPYYALWWVLEGTEPSPDGWTTSTPTARRPRRSPSPTSSTRPASATPPMGAPRRAHPTDRPCPLNAKPSSSTTRPATRPRAWTS